MNRIKFGAFLAPHHPIGEHPTLQLQSDLELVALMDKLGAGQAIQSKIMENDRAAAALAGPQDEGKVALKPHAAQDIDKSK